MSLLLAGTIPSTDLELITGEAVLADGKLLIGRTSVPINRGTAAMIGAACAVASPAAMIRRRAASSAAISANARAAAASIAI